MASVSAGAPPIFASRNWLNGDCVVTVTQDGNATGADAFKHRAYDMVTGTHYTSVGSDDTKAEEYSVLFKDGSAETPRSVRVIALLGINLKNFVVEYKVGAADWAAFSGLEYNAGIGGQNFSGTDKVVVLETAVQPDQVRVRMFTTQLPDQEKVVTNLLFADLIFQPANGFLHYEPLDDDSNRRTLGLINGFKSESIMLRSDNDYEIRACAVSIRAESDDRTEFRALKRRRSAVTFIPFPYDEPGLVYTGRVRPGSYREPYFKPPVRSAGYRVSFEFEELFGG